jgi:hypothetical protein
MYSKVYVYGDEVLAQRPYALRFTHYVSQHRSLGPISE